MFPWSALELVDGLSAVPEIWQKLVGKHLPAFRLLCLKPNPDIGGLIPCPNECGCYHRIIPRHDHTGAIAICRCMPPKCPDIPMTMEQVTPLQVERPKLSRAIARALGCRPLNDAPTALNTQQIGSWSSDAVPVFLTIQTERQGLNHAVTHLAATRREKFILLTPTKRLLTADTEQILAFASAGIFDLATNINVRADGTLECLKQPGQLFAKFSPQVDRPPSLRTPHGGRPPGPLRTPRYALRKNLGVWHLIFDYQEAFIRHEKGMFYVAWLLYHPDETPIHALDLMAKVPEIYRQQLGLPSLVDPTTGKTVALDSGARLQERSLALDDREIMRAHYRKQRELEAILDSDDATEPIKAEALRDLEQLSEFQRHHARRSKDSAERAARTVRQAITRLIANIHDSRPHPVLGQFASHLDKHIYISAPGRSRHLGSTQPPAGTLAYDPPTGTNWTNS